MTTERWKQIEEVFSQALEQPASERDRFLDRACQGDEELRREVDSLLANDSPEEPLVEIPDSFKADLGPLPYGRGSEGDPMNRDREGADNLTGRRVGAYRLVRLLGHGGMGAVYLGVRDDDQYQKQVAIKLLKRGMDTDFMLTRFRQERQILANLEHPFIARLIDGGATEEGLPYFVMEYVDGVPITKYCQEHRLSITERLRLFRLVCEAVQHAHQNLVVHRDIKPNNILTTKEGIPKLLDFGIAKVLDPGVSSGATMTRGEFRMMTPDYASPEQARGLPISTASDIYSLGAVLYELLSVRRPHRFDSESPSPVDLERTICETEPEKPSGVAAPQWKRQLTGDLDNIVLTAMRKEPQRRYASTAEFSEDIRRHMEGLPILAQEDRWGYRTGKFLRRNRLGVGAALVVAASLIIGLITTTFQARRAEFQARRAERRFEVARKLAKTVVDDVRGPMIQLPGSTALRASMIRDVVTYLDSLGDDSSSDPAFELEMAGAYKDVGYVEGSPLAPNLGQTAMALEHYGKAIALFEKHLKSPGFERLALQGTISSNIERGDIEARNGNPTAAHARFQKVASLAAEATAKDPNALPPGSQVYVLSRLGSTERDRGALAEALRYYRQALDVSLEWVKVDSSQNPRSTLQSVYRNVAGIQLLLGDIRGAQENYETGLRAVQEAFRRPDANAYDRSSLASFHDNLSLALGSPDELNLGEKAAAISHARLAIEISDEIATSDRQNVRAQDDLIGPLRNLASIVAEDQPAEALKLYQRAASISEELVAKQPGNFSFARTDAEIRIRIGELLHKLGRNRESRELLASGLDRLKTLFASEHNQVPWVGGLNRAHRALGDVLLVQGDEAGALEHYRESLAVAEEWLRSRPGAPYFERQRADSLESLGRYYQTLAKRRRELKAEARAWLQKSLDIWQDWTRRNVAAPYASVRERQVAALLASLEKM
jgi:eukaryotic-like serine/threonine-protein kinase